MPNKLRTSLVLALAAVLAAQDIKFETSARLVVVNVTVRGKDGKPLSGLTKADFKIFEDGKPQILTVFEHQDLSGQTLPTIDVPAPKAPPKSDEFADSQNKPNYNDKRLLVLYFDFSSLPQTDQIRAKEAAVTFLSKQMTSSDAVAIYTFAASLKKVVDFTSDRKLLLETVQSFGAGVGAEFESTTAEGETEEGDDTFLVDETEFAIFDVDRKFGALEDLAKELAPIPEKKAVIFFSSGVGSKQGMENQSQQQAAVNAAVRSGVAFYPIDVRGLLAMAPAGDASQGASRGTGIFSGQSQRQTRDRFAGQQETLFSLAEDTGGKALLDSNDLAAGIRQAQKDVESYYTLAYYTTNHAKDGRYRRIKIELAARKDAKLDYRPGYYADKVWNQFDTSDKERQLSEAMGLGDPVTELPLAVQLPYFRMEKGRYFVPLAIKIPGSQVGLKSGKSELDFIGAVRDMRGRTVATLRDTIKIRLKDGEDEKLAQKSLLYDAGLQMPPGDYRIKVLVRENLSGKLGTFETRFQVPDLDAGPATPVSSLVLGTAREPVEAAVGTAGAKKKELAASPLVTSGKKLALSVTGIYRRAQTMLVYGEVYGPGAMARLSLYHGKEKVWESTPIRASAGAPRGEAFPLEVAVPLRNLRPGDYTCQLTVIEPLRQRFEARRAKLTVIP